MSKRMLVFVGLLVSLAMVAAPVWLSAEAMFSGGPGDGVSGAPGEGLCTNCHAGTPNSGDGSLQISGLPSDITAGTTYTITVQLEDPGQSRWGFELTAVDEFGDGVGTFTITDPTNTQLSDNTDPARDYVKQTSTGTYAGTADGPVTWQFDYLVEIQELSAGSFNLTLYAAGNAANNNGSTSGDLIYTATGTASVSEGQSAGVPSSGLFGLIILIMLIIGTAFFIMIRRQAAA